MDNIEIKWILTAGVFFALCIAIIASCDYWSKHFTAKSAMENGYIQKIEHVEGYRPEKIWVKENE